MGRQPEKKCEEVWPGHPRMGDFCRREGSMEGTYEGDRGDTKCDLAPTQVDIKELVGIG